MKKVVITGLFIGSALVYGQETIAQEQAPAQDPAVVSKMKAEVFAKVTRVRTTMGAVVKGAPYSGVEVTETTQVLGDGTRIHNERQVHVSRDGEGRVRREENKGGVVTAVDIWDPVAQAGYHLNPATLTATKVPYSGTTTLGRGGDGQVFFYTTSPGTSTEVVAPKLMDEKIVLEKLQSTAEPPVKAFLFADGKGNVVAKEEVLGTQVIEGVQVEGKRASNRIDVGAIGNDRPIDVVSERWYSPDLKITVMTHQSDPRTGDETFRVTNIVRSEPSPDLFQVPSGYQVRERK